MFTDKQYESIGKLTIEFNELEYVIEIYLIMLIDPHEFKIGKLILAKGKTFGQKLGMLRSVVAQLAIEYPMLAKSIAALSTHITSAQQLSEKRNSIVHGFLIPRKQKSVLFFKESTKAWDEGELQTLLDELQLLINTLGTACSEVAGTLSVLREQARQNRLVRYQPTRTPTPPPATLPNQS